MRIVQKISTLLAFRTLPTTVLVVLVYATIFISVIVTDQLPNVPKNRRGLDLDQAYADLHQIAARPHPYNSHANDIVRYYILSRLRNVTSGRQHVHISNDLISNGSWSSGPYGVYFEGTNILVKIDGSESQYLNQGGVLFSAHYDSVSTAPGATDDGMGVATLMQMVEYLTENRPKRTAIFNINNGEEDWLNGAHAFLEHPWSKIPDTFLNLEGAASGGRPLLFRATSTAPLRSFSNRHVPHPHANVLSADAFARGLIRSGTDYSVYTARGMEGLDMAFYKGRSKYHTKYDSIPQTDGQERSLWAMMEAARGAGLALVNDDKTHGTEGGLPVYFDLFGATLIIFPLSVLLIFNIVFLVIGPMILLLLLVCNHVVQSRQRQIQNGVVPEGGENVWREGWRRFKHLGWLKGLWKRSKFWVAVVVTVGLQALLVFGYVKLNPFIVYSEPYLVLVSMLTLTYLSIVIILRLPIAKHAPALPEQQKHTMLLQTYILTWIFLLLSTKAIETSHIGGFYFITVWNVLAFLGCALGCTEGMFGAKGMQDEVDGERHRFVRGIRFEPAEQQPEEGGSGEREESRDGREVETEPTEITPLMHQHRGSSRSRSPRGRSEEEGGAIGWWILQLLIVIPLPVILVSHIGVLVVASLSQTLADGSSAVIVYGATSLIAFLVVLPLAPFSFKTSRWLTYLLVLIFVASTLYNFFAFPFSQETPLKVFFQQQVALDVETKSTGRAITLLTGAPGYIDRIIPGLPSARGKDIHCAPDRRKFGLRTCTWEGGLLPAPGGDVKKTPIRSTDWIRVNATRLGTSSARISVQGTNTRSCRIYIDNKPLIRYVVRDPARRGDSTMQPRYGREVRLWSRTWDRKFTVDVEWWDDGGYSELKGRLACEWVEYESGAVGVGSGGKIPALEEVLTFLPKWAVVSKAMDGLVEASGAFSV